MPGGIGGENIATSVRLFHVADVVEVFHRTDGVDAAVEVARARRGSHFDPAVVDAFCTAAPDVLDGTADEPDHYEVIAADPTLQRRLRGQELDHALEAVADFTDLRSAWRAGHSRGVAELAGQAAELAGLPAAEIVAVRRAGLLHDVGLHGVPATILDKPSALTATESERMRMHAYYTERVLARPAALARLGAIAALTHERLDGSGYHRGLSGAALPVPARDPGRRRRLPRHDRTATVPAGTVHQAGHRRAACRRPRRTAGRPRGGRRTHRRGGEPDAGGAPGRQDSRPARSRCSVLIARGASTRQVARALDISTKTAGTHIERIYAKTGASTRSTATLFALQHGLLDTLEPLDS